MEPEISSSRPPGLARRLASAVRRRARYAWSLAMRRPRQSPVEAAMEWLLRVGAGEGVPERSGGAAPSRAATAACLETVLAYGLREPAERWARWLGSRTDCQSCPSEPETARPVLSRDLARLAGLWYRRNRREAADRAMRRLERVQRRDGGFPERVGGFPWLSAPGRDVWTAKYYLDAALLRVQAAFEARWQQFPDRIDPEDGRVQAVRRWCETLAPAARVADVGCGRGRFLRHLVGWFPEARFMGVDLSPAMLAQLPPDVAALEGSLLRVPLADASLDGAFAVESLEHALLPERAVAELCRVVRPGGRVMVIDKDRRKQALSEHDPWERWPTAAELAAWLGRWCEAVTVTRVSHTEGHPGNRLFLAGEGTRSHKIA